MHKIYEQNCDNNSKQFKRALSYDEHKSVLNVNIVSDCIESMRQKNVDQFVCSQQQRTADVERLSTELKQLSDTKGHLEGELECERTRAQELEQRVSKVERELQEFKKINDIQENCIENSESEILRLSECLRVTELRLKETIDMSEEIITDLKSKLKPTKDDLTEKYCETNDMAVAEVKGQPHPQKGHSSYSSKPSFYVKLAENLLQSNCDNNNNVKHVFDIKVLENHMNRELKHFTLTTIRRALSNCPMDGWKDVLEYVVRKLNKGYGREWHCLFADSMSSKSVANSYLSGTYIKCELNKAFHLFVYKTAVDGKADDYHQRRGSGDENQILEPMAPIPAPTADLIVRVLRKSANIETAVEKFIITTTLDAINGNHKDYHTLSSYIRDQICGKYSTQWFVTVGHTQHYYTAWAMSRGRKFMLIECGDVKITIGEVGGWLW